MGRKRTKNTNLPEGMRARTWSSGNTWYYLETNAGGKRGTVPLGSNFIDALAQYCALMKTHEAPAYTFLDISKRYLSEVIPAKARKTQENDISRLKKLQSFFRDDVSIDRIEPAHIGMYKRWRLKLKQQEDRARIAKGNKPIPGDGKVAVNREITLFTGIWNFARERGFTRLPNPADGVERFPETGRKGIYTEDEVMEAVYAAGDQALRDALDLAYLTGQRLALLIARLAPENSGDSQLGGDADNDQAEQHLHDRPETFLGHVDLDIAPECFLGPAGVNLRLMSGTVLGRT